MHEPHSSGVRMITHFVRVEVLMAFLSEAISYDAYFQFAVATFTSLLESV